MTTPLPLPDRRAHVGVIARESARFREVLAAADPATRVPTCPDWDADDLLWHLAEVQSFWTAVIGTGARDGSDLERVEAAKPERPVDRAGLLTLVGRASADLVAVLDGRDPDAPAWSWHGPEQTVGFTLRRQLHEVLVHRVDAELTAGVDVTAPDADVAADGVDELLRVMWGLPDGDWASWHPSDHVVEVVATDTGHRWAVRLGRWTGTGPQSGTEFDEATAVVDDSPGVVATARVAGTAAALDLALWGRGGDGVERSGDADALAVLDEVVAVGVQ